MAASYNSPAEYIGHHLTFFTKPLAGSSINWDTIIVSVLLGFVGLGFIWWVAKGATAGVPTKRQAFVELCFDFIDDQVKGIYHGDRHKFVAPLALTVFVWVILMTSMDFLPVDWVAMLTGGLGASHGFRIVPTADINTTFALALSVWLLMIGFAIGVKGLGGFLHELFCAPFGAKLFPLNLIFNVVEYVSKPLSHSLRLYGNMYAGEIIFLLLWLLAAVGLVGAFFAFVLGLGWAIFHILIVALQAYIFMMLTIVYIQMAHEGH
jgi:F-type H+-transporting ATPase subunit a